MASPDPTCAYITWLNGLRNHMYASPWAEAQTKLFAADEVRKRYSELRLLARLHRLPSADRNAVRTAPPEVPTDPTEMPTEEFIQLKGRVKELYKSCLAEWESQHPRPEHHAPTCQACREKYTWRMRRLGARKLGYGWGRGKLSEEDWYDNDAGWPECAVDHLGLDDI
jgi:hypothetical protein